MASLSNIRKENCDGSLFVDRSCINCVTCRVIARQLFQELNGKSAVARQPLTDEEWISASQAIVSCPTNSIGSKERRLAELRVALKSFPQVIEDNVYYCGYASRASYGAASYLIVRNGGNVLIDSPKFNAQLVKQIENLGGIKYLFLTHKDDVADHALFQKHFGCERIIHLDDVTAETKDVETKIQGEEEIALTEDLIAIPTPGHTKGHMVLLYKNKFLFTGDHLAYSPDNKLLYAFDDACWHSWDRQIESVELLKKYNFEWVLPGHGDRGHINNSAELIENCVSEMKRVK